MRNRISQRSVGHSAVRHRGGRIHHRAGVVAVVNVNAIAAAEFDRTPHISLMAVRVLEFRAAGALTNLSTNSAPCCQAHWKKVHTWGSVNALAGVNGTPDWLFTLREARSK